MMANVIKLEPDLIEKEFRFSRFLDPEKKLKIKIWYKNLIKEAEKKRFYNYIL